MLAAAIVWLLFCLSALLVPLGFSAPSVGLGGGPFRFPHSSQVGLSYIFFVMATWMDVIGELFASRVCMHAQHAH